jgi:hypothetical protein
MGKKNSIKYPKKRDKYLLFLINVWNVAFLGLLHNYWNSVGILVTDPCCFGLPLLCLTKPQIDCKYEIHKYPISNTPNNNIHTTALLQNYQLRQSYAVPCYNCHTTSMPNPGNSIKTINSLLILRILVKAHMKTQIGFQKTTTNPQVKKTRHIPIGCSCLKELFAMMTSDVVAPLST